MLSYNEHPTALTFGISSNSSITVGLLVTVLVSCSMTGVNSLSFRHSWDSVTLDYRNAYLPLFGMCWGLGVLLPSKVFVSNRI